MNNLTKQKIILYLAVIFVAGGISGAVIALGSAHQAAQKPPTMTMEGVCDRMKQRYQEQLNLTDDQSKKIKAILDSTAREMKAVQRKNLEEIRQVIDKSNAEIAKELTPKQKKRFEQMEKESRERSQKGRRANNPNHNPGRKPPC